MVVFVAGITSTGIADWGRCLSRCAMQWTLGVHSCTDCRQLFLYTWCGQFNL